MSTSISPPPEQKPSVGEPFGQTGVRQYVVPAVSMISLLIASAAGVMWHRSHELQDVFLRFEGDRVTAVRSIYGRIVVTRQTGITPPMFDIAMGKWNYSSAIVPETIEDPWPQTWRKHVGVEWQRGPLRQFDPARPGTRWLRVRWPTLMVLFGALPLLRMIKHERARWRRRRLKQRVARMDDVTAPPDAQTL